MVWILSMSVRTLSILITVAIRGWCVCSSGGRAIHYWWPSLCPRISQSITIHYHNSDDHWPLSPLFPLSAQATAHCFPMFTHRQFDHTLISQHMCPIMTGMEKLCCSHGVFLQILDEHVVSFFMLRLVNGCILCNMKLFFQFVFTSQTMETTSGRQWLRGSRED